MSLNEIFLKKSEKINNVIIFYTNISKISEYIDNEIYIEYIDKILENSLENYWKWIIDSTELEYKNINHINKIISIVSIISKKYSEKILQIDIINPVWNIFNTIYFFAKFFINKELKKKIRIINYSLDIEENQNLIDF